ncbi:hypothetical protein AK812_SmicGene11042 [Symbiodinium microadriaticum]|uniref:Apple domain-containing protein n=1 Tax=Symbiodinium microadriaticum TaxID=2951 RepID=A0A1Q9EEA0_SYMMI|nr:hypothetical protein AK812_SmicGene11042 [Symbiodinium microadriaticum]
MALFFCFMQCLVLAYATKTRHCNGPSCNGGNLLLQYVARSSKSGSLVLPARTHCTREEAWSGCTYICPVGFHLNLSLATPYPSSGDDCSSLKGPAWAFNTDFPKYLLYDCATCQQTSDSLPATNSPTTANASCEGTECTASLECPTGLVLSEKHEVCALPEDHNFTDGLGLYNENDGVKLATCSSLGNYAATMTLSRGCPLPGSLDWQLDMYGTKYVCQTCVPVASTTTSISTPPATPTTSASAPPTSSTAPTTSTTSTSPPPGSSTTSTTPTTSASPPPASSTTSTSPPPGSSTTSTTPTTSTSPPPASSTTSTTSTTSTSPPATSSTTPASPPTTSSATSFGSGEREWELFAGPFNRACRGDGHGDNNPDYYDLHQGITSLEACQDLCLQERGVDGCKGVEFNVKSGRCEVWTRSEGIWAFSEPPWDGFTCLRFGWPGRYLNPMNGGVDQACRAAGGKNSNSYYVVQKAQNMEDCRARCVAAALCRGVEYSLGRCEIWHVEVAASVPLRGFTCLRYLPPP